MTNIQDLPLIRSEVEFYVSKFYLYVDFFQVERRNSIIKKHAFHKDQAIDLGGRLYFLPVFFSGEPERFTHRVCTSICPDISFSHIRYLEDAIKGKHLYALDKLQSRYTFTFDRDYFIETYLKPTIEIERAVYLPKKKRVWIPPHERDKSGRRFKYVERYPKF